MTHKLTKPSPLGTLYLIPAPIAPEAEVDNTLTPYGQEVILPIRHFLVENVRTARRFLIKLQLPIQELHFTPIPRHVEPNHVDALLQPLQQGFDLGILSEAGLPCIADPGALFTARAHQLHIPIQPLIGPSSILLALMASGLNGQSFAFNGYLPIKEFPRKKRIQQLEMQALTLKQTQLCIETPYRNNALLKALLTTLAPTTRLCIAYGIHHPEQSIITRPVQQWLQQPPTLGKVPTIFAFAP